MASIRSFIRLAVTAAVFIMCSETPLMAEPRPNILFIYLDDFGWRDTGYMGSDFYETPNLDRMAAEGMIFTDAYACAANCAPSRAGLLSGQYAARHKIYNVGTKPRGNAAHRRLEHVPGTKTLDPKIKTWPQLLQEAGYRTGIIGKWHLSDDPLPYGFDIAIGAGNSGSPPKGYYPPHPQVPGLEDSPPGEYLTDRLTSESIEFITESGDQPWALYLSHFAVHTPLDAKRELVSKYEKKTPGELHDHVAMATMIEAVDRGVGRIRKTLEARGQWENTFILFSSDNGGYGPATDMEPLKGYKGTYYEGGIRVPLFALWPGRIPADTRSPEPVIQTDLYPTICAAAGVPPSDQVADGINLLPLMTGEIKDIPARRLYWHFPAYLQSYEVYDEQRDPLFRSRPVSVIRNDHWKLIHNFEDGTNELYDLQADIGETKNLVESNPEKANQLFHHLRAWWKETGADIPTEPNLQFNAEAERRAIKKLTAD